VKVRIDWNASSDVKELMDKALDLEREDDKANSRTARSRSSLLDTIIRRCLSRYLAEQEAIRKQPAGEKHG
jgi:bacterioferritin (cytochrome b1)